MSIALTGATGHLGAALCRQLLHAGYQLRVLVRKRGPEMLTLPLEQVQGNLEDRSTLNLLCAGAEVVYHLAGLISIGGQNESALWQTNVDGTAAVLEACQQSGVRRMVHFSSIHAYQPMPANQVFDETAPPATDYPYERSKAAAQQLVLSSNGKMGLETLCLNPTAVLGPWDFKPSLQGQMILKLIRGRLPMLTPGGFDWVDSRDVALAALAAAHQGRPGEAYILSGRYTSLVELAQLIGQAAKRSTPTRTLPFGLLRGIAFLLETWSRVDGRAPLFTRESLSHVERGHPKVSSAKAEMDLAYQARPLEETVRDTCAWLQEYYSTSLKTTP